MRRDFSHSPSGKIVFEKCIKISYLNLGNLNTQGDGAEENL